MVQLRREGAHLSWDLLNQGRKPRARQTVWGPPLAYEKASLKANSPHMFPLVDQKTAEPMGGEKCVRSFPNACLLLGLSCKYLALGSRQPHQMKALMVWATLAMCTQWLSLVTAPHCLGGLDHYPGSLVLLFQVHLLICIDWRMEKPPLVYKGPLLDATGSLILSRASKMPVSPTSQAGSRN